MKNLYIIIAVIILAIPYTWFISKWMYRKGKGDYLREVFYLNRYKKSDPYMCVDKECNCRT